MSIERLKLKKSRRKIASAGLKLPAYCFNSKSNILVLEHPNFPRGNLLDDQWGMTKPLTSRISLITLRASRREETLFVMLDDELRRVGYDATRANY